MNYFKVKFVILKEIAVLKEGKNGWKKELNLVSWNGNSPKYDIRWWSPDKTNIGKGFSLTPEELYLLGEIIPTLPNDFHSSYQIE